MKMTTDELLSKLPHMIGRHGSDGFYIQKFGEENVIGWLTITHESNKDFKGSGDWKCSYDCVEGGSVCMNTYGPPWDNAICYGDTAREAIEKMYNWCVEHNFIENKTLCNH